MFVSPSDWWDPTYYVERGKVTKAALFLYYQHYFKSQKTLPPKPHDTIMIEIPMTPTHTQKHDILVTQMQECIKGYFPLVEHNGRVV